MAYYDTTRIRQNSDKKEYELSVTNNKRQEDAILNIAHSMSLGFSPSQMLRKLENDGRLIPITSVRRAISDLTRDGKLVKTDKQVIGMYGRKEYVWRLV